MLTRSGWFTIWVGAVLLIVARVFGLLELYVLGLGALALVGWALLWQLLRRDRVRVQRAVSSARVFAGDVSRVQVGLRNDGTLPSQILRITDGVAGTKGAELEVPPLDRGASTTVGFRLPTERRGLVTVGPLRVHQIDPFAIVHSSREMAGLVEILVYPEVDKVPPPPRPYGDDARLVERRPTVLGRSSDEFFALRPYVVGDDLRRVHWASSARNDDVMVRQDEMPQQGRTTILLDTRVGAANEATFERMVSAAASLVLACRARDDLVRLVSTDGADTGFTPLAQRDPALEYLAVVSQAGAGTDKNADRALGGSANRRSGGSVALLGAGLPSEHLVGASRGASSVATVIFSSPGLPLLAASPELASGLTMVISPSDKFAPIWSQAIIAAAGGRR